VLKIKYKKNGFEPEDKYIKPHTIISNGFAYYAYASYHEKNGKDIGQTRSFEFNRIEDIETVEYSMSEVFKQELFGNAFGPYNKEKYILLEFDKMSSDFFKKANIFKNAAYELIDFDMDKGILTVKMFYNSLQIEVVKIIQQWMPHIKISKEDENQKTVYDIVKKNYVELLEG